MNSHNWTFFFFFFLPPSPPPKLQTNSYLFEPRRERKLSCFAAIFHLANMQTREEKASAVLARNKPAVMYAGTVY